MAMKCNPLGPTTSGVKPLLAPRARRIRTLRRRSAGAFLTGCSRRASGIAGRRFRTDVAAPSHVPHNARVHGTTTGTITFATVVSSHGCSQSPTRASGIRRRVRSLGRMRLSRLRFARRGLCGCEGGGARLRSDSHKPLRSCSSAGGMVAGREHRERRRPRHVPAFRQRGASRTPGRSLGKVFEPRMPVSADTALCTHSKQLRRVGSGTIHLRPLTKGE